MVSFFNALTFLRIAKTPPEKSRQYTIRVSDEKV